MAIYENPDANLKFRVLTENLMSDFHRIQSLQFSDFILYAYFEINPFYPYYDELIDYHIIDKRDIKELYGDKYCISHCTYELLLAMESISGIQLIEKLNYDQ